MDSLKRGLGIVVRIFEGGEVTISSTAVIFRALRSGLRVLYGIFDVPFIVFWFTRHYYYHVTRGNAHLYHDCGLKIMAARQSNEAWCKMGVQKLSILSQPKPRQGSWHKASWNIIRLWTRCSVRIVDSEASIYGFCTNKVQNVANSSSFVVF